MKSQQIDDGLQTVTDYGVIDTTASTSSGYRPSTFSLRKKQRGSPELYREDDNLDKQLVHQDDEYGECSHITCWKYD